MNRINMTGLAGGVLVFIMLSCGESQQTPATSTPASLFPETIPSIGWSRDPEIRRFAGDSLYEYINGAAEMYHKYGFVELNVADYRKEANEIVVDLYSFSDSDKAFGMYTTLRPDGAETVALGVAGFSLGPNLLFARGTYLVSLSGYDESQATVSALMSIATALDSLVPGTGDKPAMFTLMPDSGRIPDTERVFAESFLGRRFLSDVYTVDCGLGGDTLTLFIAHDASGEKFARWSETAAGAAAPVQPLLDLPFDDAKSLMISDTWHGRIAAGLKAGRLAGVVGYTDVHRDFLATWLASLAPPTAP